MKSETIDLAPLSVRAEVGSVNEDARTVELIFSTGAAVERYDWMSGKRYFEVLAMKPENVRLDRLNAGAPLLDAHSAYSIGDVLGTVEPGSARMEKGKGLATVRFSKRAAVDPIWQDVKDGIIRSVSVGYRVRKFEEVAGKDGGIATRTATDWEPYEVSMVPMPADTGARVRSDDKTQTNPCVIITREQQEPPTMQNENTNPAPQPAAQPVANEAAIRKEAVEAERKRAAAIRTSVRVAKLDTAVADDMIGRGITIDEARAEIFEKMAAVSDATPGPTANSARIEVGTDAKDKWLRGATNWLLARAGVASIVAKHENTDVATMAPGEFRGMSLMDLARQTLEVAGRSFRGMDRQRVVAEALTLRDGGLIAQGTSDFATLLENVMNKVLQAQYAITPDTWRRFCNTSTAGDFRPQARYRMGNFSVLDALTEQGEFKNKGISDAEKATITAATKGNIVTISRQAIVNDDLNFFTQVPSRLGRAAALSIEADVYALLAQNAGLGPTIFDGVTLFHANHGNISTQAALSAAAIDADRVAMASQKEPGGNDYADLRPAVLVIGVGLGGQARVINQAQYDPDNIANKAQNRPNVVAGLFRDVVDSPRVTAISATRRYLFADPAIAPVLEVAFVDGQTSPVLETRDGWRMDGAEMKVRFDYGVAAVDYRGAVTNAG